MKRFIEGEERTQVTLLRACLEDYVEAENPVRVVEVFVEGQDASALWDIPNVLITPHTAGEARRYEDNVIDVLLENVDRLWRGEIELKNGIV